MKMVETITVSGLDCYPSESYIRFKGQFSKDESYTKDEMTILAGRILYLYDSMKYEIQDRKIEVVCYPGVVFDTFSSSPLSMTSAEDGSFYCDIRLRDIFAFCRSYTKAINGCVHRIHLYKRNNSKDLWRGMEPGTVVVDEVSLFMKKSHNTTNEPTCKLSYQKIINFKFNINNRVFMTYLQFRHPNIDSITVLLHTDDGKSQIVNSLYLSGCGDRYFPSCKLSIPPFDSTYVFRPNDIGRRITALVFFSRFTATVTAYFMVTMNETISLYHTPFGRDIS